MRNRPVTAAVIYGNIARDMVGVWIVPKTRCADTPNTSAWVELGVFSVGKVELGAAGVNINCVNGAASYVPYTLHHNTLDDHSETDYVGSDTPVRPNDVIAVHVTARQWRVATVANLTRRWTRTSTVHGDNGDLVGGQFGLANGGAPAKVAPLPGVTPISIVSTVASGKSIAAYSPGDRPGQVYLKALGTRLVINGVPQVDIKGNPVGVRPRRATVSKPQPLGGFTITRVRP